MIYIKLNPAFTKRKGWFWKWNENLTIGYYKSSPDNIFTSQQKFEIQMSDHLASFKERKKGSEKNSDDVDRRLLELSSLFEISQTLNSSLNLKSILNNVLLVPMGRMMMGKGLILIKKKSNIFRIETIKGLPHKLQGKEIDLVNLPDNFFFLNEIKSDQSWVDLFKEFKIELFFPFI